MSRYCTHCGEAIFGEARSVPHIGPSPEVARALGIIEPERHFYHPECLGRMIVGGLNHLAGRCTCCGGTEPPDPPELTRRQAAWAAMTFFDLRNR